MNDYRIVTVDEHNVDEYGFFCVNNKKHPGYITKLSWLQQRFKEGLRIKLILTKDGKRAGFLEYIPGEYTWRIVNAPGYLVIQCIWVSSKKVKWEGEIVFQAVAEKTYCFYFTGVAIIINYRLLSALSFKLSSFLFFPIL